MSGPHQPGWSDEELIALGDLHLSRKVLREQPNRSKFATERKARTTGKAQPTKPRTTAHTQHPAPRPARVSAPQQQRRQEPRPTRSTQSQSAAPAGRRQTPNVVLADAPSRASREPQTQQQTAIPINIRKLLPHKDRSATSEKMREDISLPVRDATVGVFSRKGGVGKTTITAYLGLTLASLRHSPIVAIDGDSEAGSLGWLLAPRAPSTLDALTQARPTPATFKDLSRFVTHTQSGLDLILGDTGECLPIDADGLHAAVKSLARNYDISLFDTGSGVTHSAGRALINHSRVLLLAMGPSVDSVRAAERTLAWLDEREDAANPPTQVIAVINGIPAQMRVSQIEHIEGLFEGRCAAVVRIPWDARLASGTTSAQLDALARPTQLAFQQLAATTVQTLARTMPAQADRRARYA